MRSRVAKLVGCSALIVAQTLAATAATVTPQLGKVLVTRGEGFEPLVGEAQLAPGNRVMVPQGGQATITYNDACSVVVPSGLWLVQQTAPCARDTAVLDMTGKMHGGSLKDTEPLPPEPRRDGLLIGAIAGGVIVTCIVWWCHHNGNTPVSP